jgi:hypothetical protein
MMDGRPVLDVSCTTPLFKCAIFQKCFSNARMPFRRRRWSRAFEEHDWWLVGAIFIGGDGWLGTLSVTLFILSFLPFSLIGTSNLEFNKTK